MASVLASTSATLARAVPLAPAIAYSVRVPPGWTETAGRRAWLCQRGLGLPCLVLVPPRAAVRMRSSAPSPCIAVSVGCPPPGVSLERWLGFTTERDGWRVLSCGTRQDLGRDTVELIVEREGVLRISRVVDLGARHLEVHAVGAHARLLGDPEPFTATLASLTVRCAPPPTARSALDLHRGAVVRLPVGWRAERFDGGWRLDSTLEPRARVLAIAEREAGESSSRALERVGWRVVDELCGERPDTGWAWAARGLRCIAPDGLTWTIRPRAVAIHGQPFTLAFAHCGPLTELGRVRAATCMDALAAAGSTTGLAPPRSAALA